jgi:signal-transduction protein with cAMP-binding, CBS, and nucleotidyltransferase domain
MGISEFEEAYDEDDPDLHSGDEQRLGEAILNAPIRALDPRPAAQLPETATIREAIQLMLQRGIGAVLVVKDGRVVGIFTERDVLRRVAVSGIDLARPVKDVMTPDPEALDLDDGIAFALNRMIVGGFRNVPIVDESGAPLAVLSQREVVAYIVSLLPRRILNLPPEPRLEAHSPDGG